MEFFGGGIFFFFFFPAIPRIQGSVLAVRPHAQVGDEDHLRAVRGRPESPGPEPDPGRGHEAPRETQTRRSVEFGDKKIPGIIPPEGKKFRCFLGAERKKKI